MRTGSHRVLQEAAANSGMPNSPITNFLQARWQVRHVLWLLTLSLLLLGLPDKVLATIYTCPAADGSTIFQDRPCPQGKTRIDESQVVHKLPLDIHPSWFEIPEQAEERAICDRRQCECGLQERKHGNSLARAVADALYMDGGWHRYQTSYLQWRDEPAASDKDPLLRASVQEAACSVMMSQQLLRDFAGEVIDELQRTARLAEARGFDTPEPCEAGVEQACEYLDSVELYQRLLIDAWALRQPRELITNNGALPGNQ